MTMHKLKVKDITPEGSTVVQLPPSMSLERRTHLFNMYTQAGEACLEHWGTDIPPKVYKPQPKSKSTLPFNVIVSRILYN